MTEVRSVRVEPSVFERDGAMSDDMSLFELGSTLIVHRFRILCWILIGAVLVVTPVLFKRLEYTSRVSFIPTGNDSSEPAGLRSLAGQLGIKVPGAGGSPLQSPAFLSDLVSSPMILGPIVDDTLVVREMQGARVPVLDLLEIEASSSPERRDAGIRALSTRIKVQTSKQTGALTLNVSTPWPSVSLVVAQRAVDHLNRFNLEVGRAQASQERRFIDGRLADQRRTLAVAESRLGAFLQTNRQFMNSPALTFEHGRLEREVALQQQVLIGLAQSSEEARIREVRDVPVLTVIEPPTLPLKPEPRGRLIRAMLGALVGGVVGVLLVVVGDVAARSRASGNPDAERFFELLRLAVRRPGKS